MFHSGLKPRKPSLHCYFDCKSYHCFVKEITPNWSGLINTSCIYQLSSSLEQGNSSHSQPKHQPKPRLFTPFNNFCECKPQFHVTTEHPFVLLNFSLHTKNTADTVTVLHVLQSRKKGLNNTLKAVIKTSYVMEVLWEHSVSHR